MKRKLTLLLILVSAIPLLCTALLNYYLLKGKIMDDYTAISNARVKIVQTEVANLLNAHMAAIRMIARNQNVRSLDAAGANAYLTEVFGLYPDMTLAIDDTSGQQLARGDKLPMANVGTRQYFKDAIAGQEALSDILTSKNDNRQIVVLAAPLRAQENGPIIGVAQGSLTLDKLADFISQQTTDNNILYIISKEGKILAHSDAAIAKEHKDMQSLSFVQTGLRGQNGFAEYTNEQGEKRLVSYTYDQQTGWLICSDSAYNAILAQTNRLKVQTALSLLTAILLVSLIGYLVARRTVRPITGLVDGTNAVKAGNLRIQVEHNGKDEIGLLSQNFNNMMQTLRQLVTDVAKKAATVTDAAEHLATGATHSAQANEQVANAIIRVAEGAEQQSQSLRQATTIMTQITRSIEQATLDAGEVARISEATATAAHTGNQSVNTAIVQMNRIEKTVMDSAQVVEEVGRQSQEIGQIADAIAAIAGQTNLLALNAAIEAARAGEQGRGFAVVAEEVRKLAEQAQQAAQQITGLIEAVQSKATDAVSAMQDGTREVAGGTQIVNEAGQAFGAIVSMIDQVSAQTRNLASIVQTIAADNQQVSNTLRQIDTVGKKAAAETQSVSASTQEQAASLEQISASGEALSQLAQELQSSVKRFTV